MEYGIWNMAENRFALLTSSWFNRRRARLWAQFTKRLTTLTEYPI